MQEYALQFDSQETLHRFVVSAITGFDCEPTPAAVSLCGKYTPTAVKITEAVKAANCALKATCTSSCFLLASGKPEEAIDSINLLIADIGKISLK